MKKIFSIIVIISMYTSVFAQQRIVSGTIISPEDGLPIPGVSVVLQNNPEIGTTTDIEGDYSIEVPLGSNLVFSFVGMRTNIVQVTEFNSVPAKASEGSTGIQHRFIDLPIFDDSTFVNNNSSIASVNHNQNHKSKRLRKKYLNNIGSYDYGDTPNMLNMSSDRNSSPKYLKSNLLLYSSFSIDIIDKLPELQDTYAQGRPLNGSYTWQGPETGEYFSWGPQIKNLEYDGIQYEYDKNGRLVFKGNGTGESANIYNNYKLLNTGLTYNLRFKLDQSYKKFNYSISYHNKNQKGVIPNSLIKNNGLGLRSNFDIGNVQIKYTLNGNIKEAVNQSNMFSSRFFSSLYSTPRTFDNLNGYSSDNALKNKDAYTLPDNNQRSYSQNNSDNPLWLINKNKDEIYQDRLFTKLDLKFDAFDFMDIKYAIGYDIQNNNSNFGYAPNTNQFVEGILTKRKENLNYLSSNLTFQFYKSFWDYNFRINANISHFYNYMDLDINNKSYDEFDDFSFNINNANQISNLKINRNRESHTYYIDLNLGFENYLFTDIKCQVYNSNSFNKNDYFISPSYGISFLPLDAFGWYGYGLFSYWQLHANYSNHVHELPISFKKGIYNSLYYNLDSFSAYTELKDVYYQQDIEPEKSTNLEIGTELMFFNGQISFNFDYYIKDTRNVFAPLLSGNTINLSNIGELNSRGFELTGAFRIYYSYKSSWNIGFNFSQNETIVKELYNYQTSIPIAGFTDISSNLIESKPYGVIVGTAYKRDEIGNIIIDTDGFPSVDSEPAIIGDPNPDWLLGINNNFTWKGFGFAFLIDIKKGGDIWNGTANTLNYLGQSTLTEEQRNTVNYIFEGVYENGNTNTTPVDFANPNVPIDENRWVRYGTGGVAEDAIEDGSYLNLTTINLSYNFPRNSIEHLHLKELKITLFANNLFMISNYSGVNPRSTLLGFNNGNGLDYFNTPNLKSYGFALKVRF